MAAPATTVPVVATGSSPTTYDVAVLHYVEEIAVGAATLLQQVPVAGEVCAAFLAFRQLVETARSNKDDLAELQELCNVVIKGGLYKLLHRSGPFQGFVALEKHLKEAEGVARRCNEAGINGCIKQCILARKTGKDIESITKSVVNFATVNSLVINAAVFDQQRVASALAPSPYIPQEQRRVADLANRVKVPPGAPRIRDWYIERKAVVVEVCNRLGIGGSTDSSSQELNMVGLAGPGGAGKSTTASMVVAREDVRAHFCKGVLWLRVGKGANNRQSELMNRLAHMVYETVMRKTGRPPTAKAGAESNSKEYVQGVADETSRRFILVADDVWEVEVLRELGSTGVPVLYTTRNGSLLPEAPPLRLDEILKEEAELVLRRAADLEDDARLPNAAYELMARCDFVMLDLVLVGRWGEVRGRSNERAWKTALENIEKAQEGNEGGQPLSWRAAVLRAGLEELACDNPQKRELYLALAVIPKGVAFPPEVPAVLLYGNELTAEDLEAAGVVTATLERWSILALDAGGMYRVHDEHVDFIQGRFSTNRDIRDRVLPRWRRYLSSVGALLTFSSGSLVDMWDVLMQLQEMDAVWPYAEALDKMDPLHSDRPSALLTARDFHRLRTEWREYSKYLLTLHALGVCDSSAVAFGYEATVCGGEMRGDGSERKLWMPLQTADF